MKFIMPIRVVNNINAIKMYFQKNIYLKYHYKTRYIR